MIVDKNITPNSRYNVSYVIQMSYLVLLAKCIKKYFLFFSLSPNSQKKNQIIMCPPTLKSLSEFSNNPFATSKIVHRQHFIILLSLRVTQPRWTIARKSKAFIVSLRFSTVCYKKYNLLYI